MNYNNNFVMDSFYQNYNAIQQVTRNTCKCIYRLKYNSLTIKSTSKNKFKK